MAKKRSFAEKAAKAQRKQAFSLVKYVRASVSEKTGHYRFQETMLKVPTGMTLDQFLAQGGKAKAEQDERAETEQAHEPKPEADLKEEEKAEEKVEAESKTKEASSDGGEKETQESHENRE